MAFAEMSFGRIHYEWILPNSSKSTPIVFLHEALGSIGQWKSFPFELCQTLSTTGVVYERQGHGRSSSFTNERTPSYLHDYALKELPEFLDRLEIFEPVHLVGHSDGGSIALIFAAHFPERVSRVVTLAAHAFVESETIEGVKAAAPMYEEIKPKLTRYHPNDVDALFFAWQNIWLSEEFQDWNIEQEVSNIEAQSLIVQGDHDEYGTLDQVNRLKDAIGDSATIKVIENCRHIPHLQQPTATQDVILQFLRD